MLFLCFLNFNQGLLVGFTSAVHYLIHKVTPEVETLPEYESIEIDTNISNIANITNITTTTRIISTWATRNENISAENDHFSPILWLQESLTNFKSTKFLFSFKHTYTNCCLSNTLNTVKYTHRNRKYNEKDQGKEGIPIETINFPKNAFESTLLQTRSYKMYLLQAILSIICASGTILKFVNVPILDICCGAIFKTRRWFLCSCNFLVCLIILRAAFYFGEWLNVFENLDDDFAENADFADSANFDRQKIIKLLSTCLAISLFSGALDVSTDGWALNYLGPNKSDLFLPQLFSNLTGAVITGPILVLLQELYILKINIFMVILSFWYFLTGIVLLAVHVDDEPPCSDACFDHEPSALGKRQRKGKGNQEQDENDESELILNQDSSTESARSTNRSSSKASQSDQNLVEEGVILDPSRSRTGVVERYGHKKRISSLQERDSENLTQNRNSVRNSTINDQACSLASRRSGIGSISNFKRPNLKSKVSNSYLRSLSYTPPVRTEDSSDIYTIFEHRNNNRKKSGGAMSGTGCGGNGLPSPRYHNQTSTDTDRHAGLSGIDSDFDPFQKFRFSQKERERTKSKSSLISKLSAFKESAGLSDYLEKIKTMQDSYTTKWFRRISYAIYIPFGLVELSSKLKLIDLGFCKKYIAVIELLQYITFCLGPVLLSAVVYPPVKLIKVSFIGKTISSLFLIWVFFFYFNNKVDVEVYKAGYLVALPLCLYSFFTFVGEVAVRSIASTLSDQKTPGSSTNGGSCLMILLNTSSLLIKFNNSLTLFLIGVFDGKILIRSYLDGYFACYMILTIFGLLGFIVNHKSFVRLHVYISGDNVKW